VSDASARCGRRQFLSRLLREVAEGSVGAARREERLDADRRVIESELRALGPDVLVDIARRSGLASDRQDYTAVASALSAQAEDSGDDRQ